MHVLRAAGNQCDWSQENELLVLGDEDERDYDSEGSCEQSLQPGVARSLSTIQERVLEMFYVQLNKFI